MVLFLMRHVSTTAERKGRVKQSGSPVKMGPGVYSVFLDFGYNIKKACKAPKFSKRMCHIMMRFLEVALAHVCI